MLGGITKYLRRHHVALLALFLALGGTSAYAAASFINGKQIKPNSIPKNRLTKSAVKSLHGAKGAQGLPGQRGPTGPQGPQGAPNPDATTLQGFAASSLARATSASGGSTTDPCNSSINPAFNTTTYVNAVAKTVTAPVAGVLVVLGNISFEFANAGPGSAVGLTGRLTVDGAQKGPASEGLSSNASPGSCNAGRTMSLAIAIPVAAGSHTVAYQIRKSAGDGNAFVGGGAVTTLFVPFGNGGAQGV
ncbi:MAG: hypothetical protein ACXVRD_04375, partial [Gaiellaceae bacterium]